MSEYNITTFWQVAKITCYCYLIKYNFFAMFEWFCWTGVRKLGQRAFFLDALVLFQGQGGSESTRAVGVHTLYLSFFLHGKDGWFYIAFYKDIIELTFNRKLYISPQTLPAAFPTNLKYVEGPYKTSVVINIHDYKWQEIQRNFVQSPNQSNHF